MGGLSIDQLIPWSFVSHDEFWNLCPTFKNINSSKSDGVPSLEKYLDRFCELHYMAINRLKADNTSDKILEDYQSIATQDLMTVLAMKNQEVKKVLIEASIKKAIQPIHQIALNQGFGAWEIG